jgi:hypothetical protein
MVIQSNCVCTYHYQISFVSVRVRYPIYPFSNPYPVIIRPAPLRIRWKNMVEDMVKTKSDLSQSVYFPNPVHRMK